MWISHDREAAGRNGVNLVYFIIKNIRTICSNISIYLYLQQLLEVVWVDYLYQYFNVAKFNVLIQVDQINLMNGQLLEHYKYFVVLVVNAEVLCYL